VVIASGLYFCHLGLSVAYKKINSPSVTGATLVTSEQIVTIAKGIWPTAKNIQVTPYKADRSAWSGSQLKEGFKLTISAEGGCLIAQIIAGTLDALKAKLEQRSKKRKWGTF
jgi:hypothetical protein